MESTGIPNTGGPIGVMLSEHVIGRNYVTSLADSAKKLYAGDESEKDSVIKNARYFIQLLHQHIHKENEILFPMADKFCEEKQKQAIINGLLEADKQLMPSAKKNKYTQLINKLSKDYLASS
jgi:hemerythrin-like domain-containing protein